MRLHSFRLTNRLMIIFEHEIMVLDTDPQKSTFDELREYTLALNTITYATMNQNERLLGVATVSTIRYLDFSTDNYYMQLED